MMKTFYRFQMDRCSKRLQALVVRSHLLITVLCLILLTGCHVLSKFINPSVDHLALGNPSQARVVIASSNNYLMKKPQFALSYNRSKGIPNWVSWQLDQTWLGETDRRNDFRVEQSLPPAWEKVEPHDYRRSGYDRGHMTPSGDRTNSEINNLATFFDDQYCASAA